MYNIYAIFEQSHQLVHIHEFLHSKSHSRTGFSARGAHIVHPDQSSTLRDDQLDWTKTMGSLFRLLHCTLFTKSVFKSLSYWHVPE